ncbi:hypothetical protein CsSME_00054234 [Camellia sinensis var. sinensis]
MGPVCPVLLLILLQRILCFVITTTSHDILVKPIGNFMGLHLEVEVIGLVLAEAGPASLEDVALIRGPISPVQLAYLIPLQPWLACPLMGYLACLLLSLRMSYITCWTAGLLPLLQMPPLLYLLDQPSSGYDKVRIADDLITRRTIGSGRAEHGLYILDQANKVAHHSIQSPTTKDDLWLWHRRLGHPSFSLL